MKSCPVARAPGLLDVQNVCILRLQANLIIAVTGLRKILKRATAIPKQFLIILLALENY